MSGEPIAEAKALRELAIGCPKIADEAEDGVDVRTGEGLEDRPRAPAAEKAAGVRDPEAWRRGVREPRKVLEVAAVGDRLDPGGAEGTQLLRGRGGEGDDGGGPARHPPRDALSRPLLGTDERALGAPMRVGDNRVAQVSDP